MVESTIISVISTLDYTSHTTLNPRKERSVVLSRQECTHDQDIKPRSDQILVCNGITLFVGTVLGVSPDLPAVPSLTKEHSD